MVATLPLVALVLAVCVCGTVAARTWRRWEKPGARTFALLMIFALGWAAIYAVSLFVSDEGIRQSLEIPLWFCKTAVPVSWFIFAMEYTGRTRFVSRRTLALLLVMPVMTIVLITTNGTHGLLWTDYEVVSAYGGFVAEYQPGPWLFVQTGYAYLLIGAGTLAIGEMAVTNRRLYARQAIAMVAGTLIPTVTNVVWLMTLNDTGDFDFSPIAFAATGVLFGYSLFRHDLFTLTPATWREGHRAAIDDFGDGVIIADTEGNVVDANDSAEGILGRQTSDIRLRDVADVLGTDSFDPAAGERSISLNSQTGRQEFTVTPSPIVGRHDRTIGYTVVLHDITEEKQRQQRLEVLDRVLRHNLRNTMSVVISYAESLEQHSDEAVTDYASKIQTQSSELVSLSDKVRDVDKVIASSRSTVRLDVVEAIDGIRRSLTEAYPESAITIESTDSETVRTDREVFLEVIENAVGAYLSRAAGEETVRVGVSEGQRDWLEVRVSADETRISESEREVVTRGTETQLQHGQRLDLWLVSWGVDTLEGTLRFDDDGREIVIGLPREGTEK